MAGAVGDISSNQQQSVVTAGAFFCCLYIFLRCIIVYVPHSKGKFSWIHWAYCMAVTLCAWYLLIRMIPILLNYQYNAMDKVWYMGTYETIAVIITWIWAKNKCHKQLMTASIMVIKSQPEISCCKFTKWRKRCFTLLLTLLIFQIAFAVLGIILGWLSDELSYFMLLPFKAGQLDIISGYPNLVYFVLTYQFIAAKYIMHTLMLITFTKVSQFACQSNLEWMKSSSFHLLGLTDLSAKHPRTFGKFFWTYLFSWYWKPAL